MSKQTTLLANQICTWIFYPAFGGLLLWMVLTHHPDLLRTILTCGISFVALSVYRHHRNAPRPYETDPAIEPPTAHCRSGHSFPSRHVFSAWVITMSFLSVSPIFGLLMAVPATLLAYLRQALHFHHKIDVVVGALVGITSGLIGFYIL